VASTPDQPDPAAQLAPQFLDVPWLLEASEPRRPVPRLYFFLGGILAVLVLSSVFSSRSGTARGLVEALSGLAIAGIAVALVVTSTIVVRRLRAEQQLVETIGELLQLKRWTEAGQQLDRYLAAPARTHTLRAQALIFLGSVLARYQRFGDAITVYEYLLDSGMVDGGAAYGLRLGRAMAMLREDRLVDVDRAISELRRMTPATVDSGGLALLELYRDVKTGHSDDAVRGFEKQLPAMRQQLGHRLADGWALAARAYDLMNRPEDAQRAFRNATLLSPPGELYRRYPEVKKLEGKYEPSYAPTEAA
jgi:tetratricopeptide (TPR) repeat protein